jgi:hypothetical protein
VQQGRIVNGAGAVAFLVGTFEQRSQVVVRRMSRETIRRQVGHTQLTERSAQGTRKARHPRNGREILERFLVGKVICNASGYGFIAERRSGRQSLLCQRRQRQARHQLRDARSRDAKRGTFLGRQ